MKGGVVGLIIIGLDVGSFVSAGLVGSIVGDVVIGFGVGTNSSVGDTMDKTSLKESQILRHRF